MCVDDVKPQRVNSDGDAETHSQRRWQYGVVVGILVILTVIPTIHLSNNADTPG